MSYTVAPVVGRWVGSSVAMAARQIPDIIDEIPFPGRDCGLTKEHLPCMCSILGSSLEKESRGKAGKEKITMIPRIGGRLKLSCFFSLFFNELD